MADDDDYSPRTAVTVRVRKGGMKFISVLKFREISNSKKVDMGIIPKSRDDDFIPTFNFIQATPHESEATWDRVFIFFNSLSKFVLIYES